MSSSRSEAASIRGRPCALEQAIEAAAAALVEARLPLVYGLVESTVEAQREAVRLADLAGAIVDPASSASHLGSLAAFAREGTLTASLGELRSRADLLLFWGCDPDAAHPGFTSRFAAPRAGRARLAVDLGPAMGPPSVDERLSLPPSREVEALLVLRAFVRGRRVEASRLQALGLPLDRLKTLARRLLACRYGVLVHDADPPSERRDPETPGALGALVRDASPKARLRLLGVRRAGNPAGAESVLTWQTGFPASVSFARGYPRFGPGETDAESVLRRREVDAALLVGLGVNARSDLSAGARRHLEEIPVVRIGPHGAPETATRGVFIAAAAFPSTPGRVFRMDGVALRQRPLADDSEAPVRPTEAQILARIASSLEKRALGSAP
jgi:formylmethanofuran dehydrogenase subunit B